MSAKLEDTLSVEDHLLRCRRDVEMLAGVFNAFSSSDDSVTMSGLGWWGLHEAAQNVAARLEQLADALPTDVLNARPGGPAPRRTAPGRTTEQQGGAR